MNSVVKQDFIRRFFLLLGKKLDYCILRNYETLPEEDGGGSDIDILVRATNSAIVDTIIIPDVCSFGWKPIVLSRTEMQALLVCVHTTDTSVDTVVFDIAIKLLWRGNRYADETAILKGALAHGEFFVASHGADAAVGVVKKLLAAGYVGEKYLEKVSQYTKDDPEGFLSALVPIFGNLAEELRESCRNAQLEQINAITGSLRGKVRKANLGQYINDRIQKVNGRVRRFICPPGKLIVFVGPDGSGKTTLLEKTTDYLKEFFLNEPALFHGGYELFPKLPTGTGIASMKGKIHSGTSDMTAERMEQIKAKRSTISKLATWIVVLYYTLEYVFGNALTVRLIRKNKWVFHDRYYYDWFIEPTSRDLIWERRGWLLSLVRNPDLIIHLFADGEMIHNRKPELSAEEIDIENHYLSRILCGCKNVVDINTGNHSVDGVAAEIFRIIVKRFYEEELPIVQ